MATPSIDGPGAGRVHAAPPLSQIAVDALSLF